MTTGGIRQVELEPFMRDEGRGWALNLIAASGLPPARIGGLHVVSVRPGTSRGNHVHSNATEWLLVFGGPATLVWRGPGDGTARDLRLEGLVPCLFEIPAGVAHAILNHGRSTFYLVAFYDRPEVRTESCPALCE